jgi:hypothetical protein
MNDPSRVFVSGPFAAFRERFLRSLLKWGYTPDSAANQLHLMAHLSRWLAGEGLDVQTFRENDLQRYFQFRRHAGYTHCVSMKAMLPMQTLFKGRRHNIRGGFRLGTPVKRAGPNTNSGSCAVCLR